MDPSLERTHDRTEEEDDILTRSNKKIRSERSTMPSPLRDTEMNTGEEQALSFRDKLLGGE